MIRQFMAYVVTYRDDPYVEGGRVLRVFAEQADAWNFVAEQVALEASEEWARYRGRHTRDTLTQSIAHAFQVWSGGISYPRSESADMLEIRA